MTAQGTLFGIGLGPGDPELMTLKAARLIATCPVVAYPALPGTDSFARSIAAENFPDGVHEIRLDIPMTPERRPAQEAYDKGAARIAEALDIGQDVAFLCEGDPFFYGSFMYVHARLSGIHKVEVIPGVSSVMASAARLSLPLTARNEVFTVLPAPLDNDTIRPRMESSDSFAIMKLGRHMHRIRALLDDIGLSEHAHYVERATLGNERMMPLSEAPKTAPYFSMILVTKGADPWL
ncbi:precorrin-2 C(20)-methyltransferase [Alisedimentitalea sp. MJ-SS2]|uniref:precorrin-2 C(20)-methyltransferase n=1 Tax=Aliisedimentitalea sp. MJ-SS2 TaxID=3049795 RepID=UPI00290FD444|nr:precorrin-2 C(20)-methyltransferase [Alisedimentitalea sp. MJ-SS2]MDU8929514.1 precorrin-2 C(20)-methyltransferase [Alisedimentitalea sp. MJ-SS2]